MRAPSRLALVAAVAALMSGGLAAATPAIAQGAVSPARTGSTGHPSTLVVAATGDDSAAGTVHAPLATLQAAVRRLPTGGTVEVRGGRYYQRLDLTDARRITVRPYGREHVVLDGSRFTPTQGFSAMVTVKDASQVLVGGLDITGYRSSAIGATPVGIYVHGHDDHVTLVGDHVHDMGNDNATEGSYDFGAHGIAAYGDDPSQPITNLAITGNEVDHLVLGASESVVVNGNVDGWSIDRNSIHDDNNIGVDAIGFEPTLPGKDRYTLLNRARNGVIAENSVARIRSQGNPTYYADGGYCDCADGIYVDGGTHIDVRGNTVASNDIGVEIAAENARGAADHVRVRDNTIRGSLYVGIATGGYCDGSDDCGGVTTGQSFDNAFTGNVLAGNNTLEDGSPEVLVQYYTHDDLFSRNRITATDTAGAVYGSPARAATDGVSGHNTSDHNRFASTTAPTTPFVWLGVTYATFAAYQRSTGQDRHSSFTVGRHS